MSTQKPANANQAANKNKGNNLSVSEFLAAQIDLNGYSLAHLCELIGNRIKPNMMSMLKTGRAKLPVIHVAALAEALHIDPVFLLKKVMMENAPDQWQAMEFCFKNATILTEHEKALIEAIREINPNNPTVKDSKSKKTLKNAVDTYAANNKDAFAGAILELPTND